MLRLSIILFYVSTDDALLSKNETLLSLVHLDDWFESSSEQNAPIPVLHIYDGVEALAEWHVKDLNRILCRLVPIMLVNLFKHLNGVIVGCVSHLD